MNKLASIVLVALLVLVMAVPQPAVQASPLANTLPPDNALDFSTYTCIPNGLTSTCAVFAATIPANTSTTACMWSQAWYVGTTNNSSNYWKLELKRLADNSVVLYMDTWTSGRPTYVNTWVNWFMGSITEPIADEDVGLYVKATKIGSPGPLYLAGPFVWIY